jgi:hypothetical protein
MPGDTDRAVEAGLRVAAWRLSNAAESLAAHATQADDPAHRSWFSSAIGDVEREVHLARAAAGDEPTPDEYLSAAPSRPAAPDSPDQLREAAQLAPARRGGRRHLTFDNARSEDYESVFVQHQSGEWDRILVARDDGTIAQLLADLINGAALSVSPRSDTALDVGPTTIDTETRHLREQEARR